MSSTDRQARHPVSWPVVIGFCLGVILLLISYFCLGPPKDTDGLWLDFWRTSTKEGGFAFLVATVIWTCFEFYKSTQEDDHWNDRIEAISKNVFFGVWKKNFPDGLIKQAGRLILDQTFIRTAFRVTYTITDASCDVAGRRVPFVKLNAIATCKVRNVSNAPAQLPLGIGLPNPLINEMKQFCRLNRLVVKRDGVPIDLSDRWATAQTRFQSELDDDKRTVARMDLGTVPVSSDEELEMLLDYNMTKESEDSEVFTTRFPMESISFTITDKGLAKRVVRARAIHTDDLEIDSADEATGTYCFRLPHWLLPEQGFIIWWKSVPDRSAPPKQGGT